MRRRLASGLATLVFISGLAGGISAKTTLNVWVPWGGDRVKPFEKITQSYESKHPGIQVKFSSIGGDFAKFLTACSAGSPPDIQTVGGPQIPEYVEKKLLTPLKSYYSASGIAYEDLYFPSRHQMIYKGEIWGLPFETNPCFALMWNKQHFAEAGLDENKPPVTLEDLEMYMEKLTKKTPDGKITRIGYGLPSGTYDYANSLANLSWIFGGNFYDEDKETFMLDEPKTVKALTWWVELYKRYDFNTKINPGGYQWVDKFQGGKASMAPVVPNLIAHMMPKDIRWGITGKQPYPANGGVKNVSWDGGWTLAIPKSAKHKKEAWDFMKWFLTSNEATSALYKSTGVLVGYRKANIFAALPKEEPSWGQVAVDMLENSKFGRPVSPATNYCWTILPPMITDALMLKKSPKQVLTEANNMVNKELDKWKKRRNR